MVNSDLNSLIPNVDIQSEYISEELKKYFMASTKTEKRLEIIKDYTGTWIRDNKTGLEYSAKTGLKLLAQDLINF